MDIGSEVSVDSDRSIRALLFGGEEMIREITTDSAQFAVTTHRLLVYDPEADGKRFEHVYHPNIVDVDVGTTGSTGYASRLPQLIVYGAVFLGSGWIVRAMALPVFDRSLPSTGTRLVGTVTRTLGMIVSGLELLATLLVGGGVVLLCGAALVAAMEGYSRRNAIVIERAGDDPIEYPVAKSEGQHITAELTTALRSVRDRDDY